MDNAIASSKSNENKFAGLPPSGDAAVNKLHTDRPEKMMQAMKQDNAGGDTEMNQINSMLDKVKDLQHPEWVIEKFQQNAAAMKQPVFPVIKE